MHKENYELIDKLRGKFSLKRPAKVLASGIGKYSFYIGAMEHLDRGARRRQLCESRFMGTRQLSVSTAIGVLARGGETHYNAFMKLILMGTGTSYGIPVIGCDCAVCHSADPRDTR